MVDRSSELWEVTSVLNRDFPGQELVGNRITLVGFMMPSVFPGQKILYQVEEGAGLFFIAEGGMWCCYPAPEGFITDIERGQEHFFFSPDGEMKIFALGSASLFSLRQRVEAPATFLTCGTVIEIHEDGAIVCQTPLGMTPPAKPSRAVSLGSQVTVTISFAGIAPVADDDASE